MAHARLVIFEKNAKTPFTSMHSDSEKKRHRAEG